MNLSAITLHVPDQSKIAGRLDFVMVASGALLILFLWAHLLLVSSVVLSPAIMNALAHFFEATYMAQVGGPAIFVVMVVHFILAARKMPFEQGEWKAFVTHGRMLRHKDTTLWLVQVISAIVILVLASVHVFTVLSDLPISAAKSAARVQGGTWLSLYLVLLPMAEMHVGIGFYRIGIKYGFISSARRAWYQRAEVVMMGGFVGIGLLTLARLYWLSI
ncbi:succinate dehydrogenase/fumarate reductase cytochrome b subunit [Nitratidesulfovibrio liaohensis]|uniref:succinate dehydrogenase/fumarate reductase cytochrome b subunit n=1 Tax=Nitratidesulfovibrio liaohensis TaxID=2604158 RepID=UPI00141E1EFA|nr:succinate dehydrogenase/fumarate reductase cytochrome b subunit [Nitratidesulfovibrio liaohensis]NHZ45277.1 succinate dehydrogenase/fumarate reductase cytochrome b subunit [Nitratidesulfovibrio liaohensis]